MYCRLWFG